MSCFFKYDGCLAVSCENEGRRRRGGLCILWRSPLDLSLINYSNNHILMYYRGSDSSSTWYISGLYGWPENSNIWRT